MAKHDSNRINFTRGRVESFTCPAGKEQTFLWDSGVRGLGIRATAGSKTYIFQARLHGRTLRHKIGPVDGWDIDKARKEATDLRALVDKGIDPRAEKAERAQAVEQKRAARQRATVTVADAWDVYVRAREGDWSEAHRRDHKKAMTAPGQPRKYSKAKTKAGILYPLRGERLEALTAGRIAAWLDREKAKRPTLAAKGYRLLRTFLNWCAGQSDYRGLVDSRELLTKDVRRSVPKVRAKNDCLEREQLALWFKAVREIGNPVVSAYLQALLLTGARRTELAALRWGDVDLQWRSMTLRDKIEGERTVPLPPYLASLLDALPRRPGNPWVFSSTRKTGRIGEVNKTHTRAINAAGLPHVTLHGLRRSFGTLSEWVECPVGVVAQIMGHKPSAIAEKHYRRRPLDLLRVWHTKIEGWMLEQAGIPQPPEDQATGLRAVK
jgi:integrase